MAEEAAMKATVRSSSLGVLALSAALLVFASGTVGAQQDPRLSCPETILAGQTITCELTGGEPGVTYHIHAEVTVLHWYMDDMADDFGHLSTESPASLEFRIPEHLGYTQGSFWIGEDYEIRVPFRIGLPEGHPDLALACHPGTPSAGEQVQCDIVGAVPLEQLGVDVFMKRTSDDWPDHVEGLPQEMSLKPDETGDAAFQFLLPSDADGEMLVRVIGRRGSRQETLAVSPISSEAPAERGAMTGPRQSAEEAEPSAQKAEPSVTVDRPTRVDAGGGGTASH